MPPSRRSPRLQLASPLSADVTVLQPARVTELGADGMRVETAFPLPLGSLHEFRLPLDARPIVVRGRIVHASVSGSPMILWLASHSPRRF